MANQSEAALEADEALLRLAETRFYSGHGPSWTWNEVKEGRFPKPIHIGKSARWLRSELLAWQRKQIERSRGAV